MMSASKSREPSTWRISSYSPNSGGNCVEAGPLDGRPTGVAVRDTTNRDGAMLAYRNADWVAFVASAHAGKFDLRA